VSRVLIDTGPLIAFFDHKDSEHRPVDEYLRHHRKTIELLTTWPVVTEVCHLLPRHLVNPFLQWVWEGNARLCDVPASAIKDIADMMAKYSDLPMDLADASLLWLAENGGVRDILTLDARDFAVYRLSGGHRLRDVLAGA
jgi:uncharacterized protein